MLNYGLTNFDTIEIAKSGKSISKLDVWLGQSDVVDVYSNTDIYKTVKKAKLKKFQAKIIYDGPLEAPIEKDEVVAKLVINFDGNQISEHDLLASYKVKKKNIISRILTSINYLIWGDV